MSKDIPKIKLPSMLSFERKLEVSDGLMFAGNWDDINQDEDKLWQPIPIVPRQNRSTQSAYGIDDIKKTAPNPVSSDSDDANLPMDKNTLKLSYTLRVIGNLGKPFACNSPNFSTAIEQKAEDFKSSEGISELALRYAYNIANGRFLWRNRVGAEDIKIVVTHKDDTGTKKLEFSAYNFSLNDFKKNYENENLLQLVELVRQGLLSNENKFIFISVDAFVKLGSGQHIFPSQEMNMGEKKKVLFRLDTKYGLCAAVHNVKLGNAIRTIDNWYGDTMLIKTEGKGKTDTVNIESPIRYPIAIEPYGSVTQHGRAYRDKNIDLYRLMLDWVNDKTIETDQQCFIIANLIRGGVFGGDS